jgi:hypothetical protein
MAARNCPSSTKMESMMRPLVYRLARPTLLVSGVFWICLCGFRLWLERGPSLFLLGPVVAVVSSFSAWRSVWRNPSGQALAVSLRYVAAGFFGVLFLAVVTLATLRYLTPGWR